MRFVPGKYRLLFVHNAIVSYDPTVFAETAIFQAYSSCWLKKKLHKPDSTGKGGNILDIFILGHLAPIFKKCQFVLITYV